MLLNFVLEIRRSVSRLISVHESTAMVLVKGRDDFVRV